MKLTKDQMDALEENGSTEPVFASDETALEQHLRKNSVSRVRLTPESIDSVIASESYHIFEGTTLTVCCLTLANGYQVTGESACVDPANFNEEVGRAIARKNAREKIWTLEGYLLKEQQHVMGTGNFTTRLVNEYRDLGARLAKLDVYRLTDAFSDLPKIQRDLLDDQALAMSAYMSALSARLADLDLLQDTDLID